MTFVLREPFSGLVVLNSPFDVRRGFSDGGCRGTIFKGLSHDIRDTKVIKDGESLSLENSL